MTRLAILLFFMAELASCGKQRPDAETAWPMRKLSSGGAYTVSIQAKDGKVIKQHEHFSLEISLQPEAADSNAELEKIVVTADMPAHRHGMNTRPEISRIERNQYRADGMLFHMAGDWVITVELYPSKGKWEQVDFPILIK